ncbi:MAG: 50S ribosomal protein L29 [Candidatus Micrarchaeota archaeon]|nr:50S ribosomal protein L29 [Candidatus Micrarchaeota archaeon]
MKAKELREKSDEELKELLEQTRLDLIKVPKNKRRPLRRLIARILTILRERGNQVG